ncbi:MAG TPA: vanadium-dependent haloperoxidase [Steroidobacteraceae bacterium]|nr:vanadium-dependent haloperoxidase [Steroidobacteraceae bacterium]
MKTLLRVLVLALVSVRVAAADAIVDWNIKAGEIITAGDLGPPPASRAMAIMHTAAYEAANAIARRYPAPVLKLDAAKGASVEAAIAAASHLTLRQLVPSQQPAVDAAYQEFLARIPDGAAKVAGVEAGVAAATQLLEQRANDGAMTQESYRPFTTAGVYVPTTLPAVPQWPGRNPCWNMTSASQFRPGPPPALGSALWARDYNEIKAVGARQGSTRTAEQTAMARFWEATRPTIYYAVVRVVANMHGRDVLQNTRLFAVATQAADDALIAVFDGKYTYGFWRPITAIRNGDIDGNDATERDPSWRPFIDTPMHPEYPCAHCIVAAAFGEVLRAEIGTGPVPTLTTTSPTADNVARSWTTIDAFVQEVSNARIYDGVHFRNSTEVGAEMGQKIGALAVARHPQKK